MTGVSSETAYTPVKLSRFAPGKFATGEFDMLLHRFVWYVLLTVAAGFVSTPATSAVKWLYQLDPAFNGDGQDLIATDRQYEQRIAVGGRMYGGNDTSVELLREQGSPMRIGIYLYDEAGRQDLIGQLNFAEGYEIKALRDFFVPQDQR